MSTVAARLYIIMANSKENRQYRISGELEWARDDPFPIPFFSNTHSLHTRMSFIDLTASCVQRVTLERRRDRLERDF